MLNWLILNVIFEPIRLSVDHISSLSNRGLSFNLLALIGRKLLGHILGGLDRRSWWGWCLPLLDLSFGVGGFYRSGLVGFELTDVEVLDQVGYLMGRSVSINR